jgi:hypothetical protein
MNTLAASVGGERAKSVHVKSFILSPSFSYFIAAQLHDTYYCNYLMISFPTAPLFSSVPMPTKVLMVYLFMNTHRV